MSALSCECKIIEPDPQRSPDMEPFLAVKIVKDGRVVDAMGQGGIRECEAELHSSFSIPLSCIPAIVAAVEKGTS